MSKIDMSKIDTSRIDTGKIDTGKIDSREDTNAAVRIVRNWRGYAVGAIIRPPGSVREMLLEARDETGRPVAELVEGGGIAAAQSAPPVSAPAPKSKKRGART